MTVRNALEHAIIATADGGAMQGMCLFQPPTDPNAPGNQAGMMLHPAHEVTVTVVDGRGAPVPDAAVFVLDLGFPAADARTDARGIAVLRVPSRGAGLSGSSRSSRASASTTSRITRRRTPRGSRSPPREARLVLTGSSATSAFAWSTRRIDPCRASRCSP